MNEVCRLCLSVCSQLIHNLYDNGDMMLKISSCFQVDILKDESLPNQMCLRCSEKLDQMLTYSKTVMKNQNILCHYLKLGKSSLDHFYSILKDSKEIKEENLDLIKEELDENVTATHQFEFPMKTKGDQLSVEENNDFSSDDNITLLSLKEKGQSDCLPENTFHKNTKKKHKTIFLKCSTEAKENIKHTKSNLLKTQEFKCLMCLKIYDTCATLTKHYRNAHRPVQPLTSEKITYSEIRGNENKYKCGKCEKMFRTKKAVKGHIQYKHQEIRPYICKLCGRTYKVVAEIINHSRAHSGARLFCPLGCGYNTAYAHGLRSHERKHRNQYKYKCEECGKGFEIKSWFEEHQNVHTGAKPFACSECKMAYHCKRYLVRHQTTAHPASLASSAYSEVRHVCTLCALPCLTKVVLKAHLATEHGIKQSFLCDVCGKSFQTSSRLITHKKRHLGVKSFTCSTCNKCFSTRGSLRRHERTHGAREQHARHACEQCGQRFVHRAARVRHELRRHSVVVQK